jgi:hypothetical protein
MSKHDEENTRDPTQALCEDLMNFDHSLAQMSKMSGASGRAVAPREARSLETIIADLRFLKRAHTFQKGLIMALKSYATGYDDRNCGIIFVTELIRQNIVGGNEYEELVHSAELTLVLFESLHAVELDFLARLEKALK